MENGNPVTIFDCESQSTAAVKMGLDVLCCPLVSETTQWVFPPKNTVSPACQ